MENELAVVEPERIESPQVTPMQMLQMAVSKGVDTEQLTKLMDLNDRYQATEARKAFVVALNAFKANPPEIFKNKQVSFGSGKTSYKHATLDNVSGVIGAALAKVGISHRWDTEQLEGGLIRVTCILTHALGHSERVPLQAKPDDSGSKNSIQAVGSTVTYLQRYTLLSATGMAVGEADDDGNAGKVSGMADTVKADYLQRIDACTDKKAVEVIWKTASAEVGKLNDLAAYAEIKAKVADKVKSLGEI